MDRRTRRTRRLLGEALIDLLQTHDLQALTIRQITDRADVAYSTFFRNFESVDDLLLTHMRGFVERLQGRVQVAPGDPYRVQAQRSIETLFIALQEDPRLPRVLFQTPAAQPVLTAFRKEQVQINIAQARQMGVVARADGPPPPLVIHNAVVQLFGLIVWWLEQGLQPDPATMAAHYELLVLRPMWTLLLGPAGMAALFGETDS